MVCQIAYNQDGQTSGERNSHELLGVHIIGESASELAHIGQAVLTYGGKIDYFIHNVFNYPTLAEGYKNAAFDGINRLVE
jgi:NAD(P) transhydrogenase